MRLAESPSRYLADTTEDSPGQWLQVLVDCVYAEGLYTYRAREDTQVKPGDIVAVPFGESIVGGVVVKVSSQPPTDLELDKIKPIDEVITTGFFPPHYWQLLERTAQYYLADLIEVVKVALPPKLLGRAQRRVKLLWDNLPKEGGIEDFCSVKEWEVVRLLQKSKQGDYSYRFVCQKIANARKAIQQLVKRKWLEVYLQPPARATPKYTKIVTFLGEQEGISLSRQQREVLRVLKNHHGELPLPELKRICNLPSDSIIRSLCDKGCVVVEERETLRLLRDSNPPPDSPKPLTPAQQQALHHISQLNAYATVLLHGVTGSGKTEIYLQAIAPILAAKKSALVLVPEIGLTPQLTDRFRARFGDRVCVYHSALSDGERYDTWRQMLTGQPMVVVGTRSAVFAPLPHLGIIIIDEEHDPSFKQQQPSPHYHAVTVAKWRAELENCPLILGSATPSLETWHLATKPNPSYHYLFLPERIHKRPLPPVEIIDMRAELKQGNRTIFSHRLRHFLSLLKPQGKQAILFIPRRGHSTFVSCRSCGYVMECPHCDVSLSYHYTHQGTRELLRCHYCNYTEIHPQQCPQCFSPYFKFFGTGTQKVVLELEKEFPQLRVLRFDSDTTSTKNAHRRILSQFASGEADVLVGTQMLTKGIDIPNVTLVGVVSADGLLFHADFQAAERAFQTLTQVAGRAGRGEDAGRVIIQTYSPSHPVLQAVKTHNYIAFAQQELQERASLNYPPYGYLILLLFTGLDGDRVRDTASTIASLCERILPQEVEILGPAPAKIMRIADRYRWQILLKSPSPLPSSVKAQLVQLRQYCPSSVSLTIDVDPLRIE